MSVLSNVGRIWSPAIKSNRLRWMGQVGRVEYIRSAYTIWVGNPEGKRLLGRSRCEGKDYFEI